MEDRTHCDDARYVRCKSCGEFIVTKTDFVNLMSNRLRSQWSASHLSSLLREQSIQQLPRIWLQYGMVPYGPIQSTDVSPVDLNELLRRWPRTVPERLDRCLCNLGRLSPTGGHELSIDRSETSLVFATTAQEAQFNIQSLVEYGFLAEATQSREALVVVITPEGWRRFELLTQGSRTLENPVFVAMWFGDAENKSTMDDAYQTGILPAIEEAGFRATRVDLTEHNDWIMDKVLGDIRVAPFVVADFSGNRNGVYFEAGFARGLGIPVIHTCRANDLEQAHFDTKQLNHVLWKAPADLHKTLYHRIAGTIGQGPFSAQKTRKRE